MLVSFANDTVVIVRAARVVDDFRDAALDWSEDAVTLTTIEGCSVQPVDSAEVIASGREALIGQRWVFLPPRMPDGSPVDVDGLDRVRLDSGADFAIVGEPQPMPSPTGGLDHIYLRAKRVGG